MALTAGEQPAALADRVGPAERQPIDHLVETGCPCGAVNLVGARPGPGHPERFTFSEPTMVASDSRR